MSDVNAHGQVVLRCRGLPPMLALLTERLGFAVVSVFPADNPQRVVVEGHGLRLRLVVGTPQSAVTLQLPRAAFGASADATPPVVAPNGTRFVAPSDAPPRVAAPTPSLVVTHAGDETAWVRGRASMEYRDLIPGRQGGFVVASHIRITEGGVVPDYVHFHDVAFQMIYCWRGWVRVVYEGQGEPFVMAAGDCVLQPPRIRHRVLECSAGLEVLELSVPAAHETLSDRAMTLPNASIDRAREFAGQRFVRHCARDADDTNGVRDTGIGAATGGLAEVRVVRPGEGGGLGLARKRPGLHCAVVVDGTARLDVAGRAHALRPGSAFVLPPDTEVAIADADAAFEVLEVDVGAPPAG